MTQPNNGGTEEGAEQLYTQADVDRAAAQARREGRREGGESARPAAAAPSPQTTDDAISRAIEQGIARGLAAIGPGATHQPARQPIVAAAAPNAPAKVDLITMGGLVDVFSLMPDQLENLGPAGLREIHERNLKAGAVRSGAPPIPGATLGNRGGR